MDYIWPKIFNKNKIQENYIANQENTIKKL